MLKINKIRRDIYGLIPDRLKFTFSSIWENFKNGQPFFSQNGEDIVILKLLKNRSNGFYIDIGAHHPKKYSNTHMLYKRGWRGINIDANPKSIKEFNKARPHDINLNIGINDTDGKLTYYQFADPAVNTFSESQAQEWINNRTWNKFLGKSEIEVRNINSVLEEHLPNKKKIDLISIDVESLDFRILKSLDLSKYKPELVVIEDHYFNDNHPERSEIYNYMINNNYRLHCNLAFSLIFKNTKAT